MNTKRNVIYKTHVSPSRGYVHLLQMPVCLWCRNDETQVTILSSFFSFSPTIKPDDATQECRAALSCLQAFSKYLAKFWKSLINKAIQIMKLFT